MPNYFYIVEDDTANGYEIYRTLISGGQLQKVTSVTPASGTTQDLEGLATFYNNSGGVRIDAVSEGNDSGNGSTPQGYIVKGVDAGTPAPSRENLTTVGPDTDDRFGNETGADYFNGVLYNLQGNDVSPATAGSRLYSINENTGATTAIGTQKNEFADGLAINSNNGAAFASDFATQDGDINELYKVNLSNGNFTQTMRLVKPNGSNLGVNFDSGLAFDSTGKLYALTENGSIYQITDFTDNDGTAVATLLRTVNPAGPGELEGFAIINEPTTPTAGLVAAKTTTDVVEDRIVGAEGEDLLTGTEGSNSLLGKAGNDILEALGGDDILKGNRGADSLYGGEGLDVLLGGKDSDLLWGGAGNDVLTGDAFLSGIGQDSFVLASGEGVDRITDFQIGEDFLVLTGGLELGNLSIEGSNGNTKIAFADELIAVLNNVNSDDLIASGEQSFIIA
jgi:Ca2+-binding RTX toxin-like protein